MGNDGGTSVGMACEGAKRYIRARREVFRRDWDLRGIGHTVVLALCHECARTLSRDVVCSFCMGFVMYTRLCVDYVRSCGLKGYEEGASRCLCFVCESMPVLCVRASFIRAFSEIEPFDWGLLTPLSQQPSHGGSTYRYL